MSYWKVKYYYQRGEEVAQVSSKTRVLVYGILDPGVQFLSLGPNAGIALVGLDQWIERWTVD